MKEAVRDGVMVTHGASQSEVITFFAVVIFVFAVIFVFLENRNKPLK